MMGTRTLESLTKKVNTCIGILALRPQVTTCFFVVFKGTDPILLYLSFSENMVNHWFFYKKKYLNVLNGNSINSIKTQNN